MTTLMFEIWRFLVLNWQNKLKPCRMYLRQPPDDQDVKQIILPVVFWKVSVKVNSYSCSYRHSSIAMEMTEIQLLIKLADNTSERVDNDDLLVLGPPSDWSARAAVGASLSMTINDNDNSINNNRHL